MIAPIAVLGSGSWGTALAIQFARAGKPTHLWGRDAAQRAAMRAARVNARYLPDARFPDNLSIADSLEEALAGVSDVVVAVPSSGFRGLLTELKPRLTPAISVAWATKGFERDTGLLPHQVARAVLGDATTMGVLSGPTFAREVGAGLPTAMVVASADEAFAMRI
ncbi:MAG: 2-dehydropantoate 2-reductase N-terminal domain-containing protein, partial [Pseudomonadota bacterium]